MISSRLLASLAVGIGSVLAAPAAPALAPLYPAGLTPIPGSYLVSIKEGHTLQEHLQAIPELLEIGLNDFGHLLGYGARLSDDLLYRVRQDPTVEYVEQDAQGSFIEIEETSNLSSRVVQNNAGYALTYISSTTKNTDAAEVYYYLDNAGSGVDLYIMDSGITNNNNEFGGRVTNFINLSGDNTFDDSQSKSGHGTNVAACAGSKTYGSAKQPNLINTKIKTTTSVFVSALTQVTDRHNTRKSQSGFKGSVVSMAFGVDSSKKAIQAVKAAYEAGITLVAAAGNDGKENTDEFPCASGYVICAAASTSDYVLSKKSNYGTNVEVVASGYKVDTLSKSGSAAQLSGTSLSTGYVAGVASIFYGYQGPSLSPDRILDLVYYNADNGYLDNLPSSQRNVMLNSGFKKGNPYLMSPPS